MTVNIFTKYTRQEEYVMVIEPSHEKTNNLNFPSDPILSQKQDRSLKFGIKVHVEEEFLLA